MAKKSSGSASGRRAPGGARNAARSRGISSRRAALPDELDVFIDAAADALDLPVRRAWKPAVKTNLQIILRMGGLVSAHTLDDEVEPAAVFRA